MKRYFDWNWDLRNRWSVLLARWEDDLAIGLFRGNGVTDPVFGLLFTIPLPPLAWRRLSRVRVE